VSHTLVQDSTPVTHFGRFSSKCQSAFGVARDKKRGIVITEAELKIDRNV